MPSPRWQKVLRDLWASKTRTMLVVLSIAVGVFAIGMISSTQAILSRDLNQGYANTIPASAIIYTDPFDDELVQSARNVPGVRFAEGRRTVSVRLKVGPQEWRTLQLTVIPDFGSIRLNKVRPERGAWPPGKWEVLLERGSLGEARADVGDVRLIEMADGKTREILVAGIAYDVNAPPPSMTGGVVYGYISLDTAEWLGLTRDFNELRIVVAENGRDKEHIKQVADRVAAKVKRSDLKVYRTEVPEPGRNPMDAATQPVLLLLGVMGYLILALSGFLVINTISAVLAQQVRQVGIMKTIGARTGQIAGMYLVSVLIFGLLSLIVAVPLANVAAGGLIHFLADFLNSDISDFRTPNDVLIVEVVVAIAVPLIVALFPVLGGTRITVREALNEYGIGKAGATMGLADRLLERLGFVSRPLLLSLRNTFRRKGRLALTLVTLTLGGGIFIGVFSVRASLLLTLDDALAYWKYDVSVSLSRAHRIDRIEAEVRRVPEVVTSESWGMRTANRVRADGSKGTLVYIVAPPGNTALLQPTIVQGRWLLPDDESAVVVNTLVVKEEPDIKTGDQIVLKIGEKEHTFRVVGLARGVMTGPIAYINYPYFARITHSTGLAEGVQVVTQGHGAAAQTQVAKALEQRLESAGMRVQSTEATSDIRKMIEDLFNIIVGLLSVMAVLLAVVGGLGLMGTMSINVLERTREIGVMRAIGASDGAVRQIVIVEGLLIGVLSWFMGAALSLPLSMLLSNAVGEALFRSPLSYTFSITGALLWLGVVVVIATLASLLPARNASHLSIREALAYG
ncbi:MAG: ABC transporter permease [Bacteroidetes bacterium]|nr:ABC transporter permease [Bacteroidota bacterium]